MTVNQILHLGLGAFHRAHQAVYLENLHLLGDRSWKIIGGNLRYHPSETDLVAAHGKYILETVTPQGDRTYQKINSIDYVIPYDVELKQVWEVGSSPETKIISFTVTEAGYYLNSKDQLQFILDIDVDLKKNQQSKMGNTIYGNLYLILKKRSIDGNSVTLMCCDNLRHNGDRFKSGMEQYIKQMQDQTLLDWFQKNCSCPNSMVDRITPRPTSAVIARVKESVGVEDKNALMSEKFIQWVLEDQFVAGRPKWERVGVEVVEDVSPYEEAKIRILNATHSCIAWAGALVGYRYIHEGTLDLRIKKFAYDYVTDDVIPILLPSPVDLFAYRDVILERFSNHDLFDTNQRVAMDGFSKLPGFIIPTIRERLNRKESIKSVIMLPALFLCFIQDWNEGKIDFDYEDQVMDKKEVKVICSCEDPIVAFCENKTLWGDLKGRTEIIAAMRSSMTIIDDFRDSYLNRT